MVVNYSVRETTRIDLSHRLAQEQNRWTQEMQENL